MLELNKIYCADCLELMMDIPDKSIDLVLTDPPYGIGASNVKRGGRQDGASLSASKWYPFAEWDNKRLERAYFDLIFRLSNNQIIFGGNYYVDYLVPSSCWIVWDKDNGENQYADCELIWTSFPSAVRKIRYRWMGMLQENMADKDYRQHPTQKPVGVMKWIIENYSRPTDLILDPFCGSGTTCVAAKLLGRNYIGIDISEDYCEIARKRLANTEECLFGTKQSTSTMPILPDRTLNFSVLAKEKA